MKDIRLHLKRTALASSTTALALFVSLALSTSATAKKGGKPGGGGDPGDGVTINPVPHVAAPPVSYTVTELKWHGDLDGNREDDDTQATFGGISLIGINNKGIAVGNAKGPDDVDPELYGWRVAVANLAPDPALLVDLNEVFAAGLQELNLGRTEAEEWRIYTATRINDGGLLTCLLIPASAPRRFRTFDAADLGIEPTPCLYAVADLDRRNDPDAIMLVPMNTSPNGDFLDFNELGDVLMFEHDPLTDSYETRLLPLAEDSEGTLGYHRENELTFPELSSWNTNRQSFNSANEVIFRRAGSPAQLVRYSSLVGEETVLLEGSFLPNGIANDGTAYATVTDSFTTGKGRNRQTTYTQTPYHIISATERTPLTEFSDDGNAIIGHFAWHVSSAAQAGEEEILIQLEDTGGYQLYKPNYQARFPLTDIAPGSVGWLAISTPIDQSLTTEWDNATGSWNYAAGYIAYRTTESPSRAYVLTPSESTIPGQSSAR